MKQTFTTLAFDRADRTMRAIPDIDVPSLAELGRTDLLAGQRRLAVGYGARIIVGLGVAVAAAVTAPGVGALLMAVLAAWMVYGGSLTVVHHLIHGPLGLPERARRWMLTIAAAIVLESGHALVTTHMLHHATDPDLPDVEGTIEEVPWRLMPLAAPLFRYRLMWFGVRNSPVANRVRSEIAWHVVFHVAAVALLPWTWIPAAYAGLIFVSSSIFAVLAGKGPQTNYGRRITTPLVRIKSRWARALVFNHDKHLEHHAYPTVPLARLRHLDQALAPHWERIGTHDVVLP